MSYLLTTPRTVLLVGLSQPTVEDLRPSLLDGVAESLEAVEDETALTDAVAERDDVACVLVGDEDGVDPVAACRRVREADERVSVVAFVADGDEGLAHRFLAADGDDYVPRPAGDGALRETVDDAVEDYERRRDEHAQSTMFDSLLSNVSLPLYAKDEEARYVRVSVVPEGRNPEKLRGSTDLDVYDADPDAVQGWYEDDLQVIESGEGIFDKEERYNTLGGEHWSRTTKVPWRDGDEVVGLVGVSFSITKYVELRYRLEEYRERFEKFADSVSHDLRNPLQVASGNLELARETGDEEAFERAEDAIDRMSEMIGDLSELATEEQHTLSRSVVADRSYETLSLVPVELVDLFEDVWAVLEPEGATLTVDLPEDARIYAPESALRTIVENLLKNAIRHAGPDASVHIGAVDDGGFYVADDGPGIDADQRDRIFEEGFTTAQDGSGTGLAMVADAARSQNWRIDVTESAAGGARFELSNCLYVSSDTLYEPTGDSVELTQVDAVGDFDVDGSATYDEGTGRWTVTGGGTNIWQQTNEFQFVHVPVDGPVSIRARVQDLEDVGEYSKAGVMVRDSLDADATYGHVGMIPDARTEVLWRTRPGEDGVSQFVERTEDGKPWFRIDRVDGTVTVAVSNDGEEWTPVNERRVRLSDPVHVGLVVCSYRPKADCTASFEDVAVRRLDAD